MRAVAGRRREPVAKDFTPADGEAGAESAISAALNQSWPLLDAAASAQLARDMVEARNVDGYLASLPWDEFITAMGQIVTPMAGQIGRTVRAATADIGPIGAKLTFANMDVVSIKYAQQQSGRLIQAITDSQREAIREVMAQALAGRHTVPEAARLIRGSIGLHPRWADAVTKYHTRQMNRLVREGMPFARATVRADAMALTYRNRLIRRRSETIARTEVQTSSNLGRFATWSQMIGSGAAQTTSQKEWAPGPGACGLCSSMAGETVGWDQPFSNGAMMPPAHPNCRCAAVLIPRLYSNPILSLAPINWLSPLLQDPNLLDGIGGEAALAAGATTAGSDPFGLDSSPEA